MSDSRQVVPNSLIEQALSAVRWWRSSVAVRKIGEANERTLHRLECRYFACSNLQDRPVFLRYFVDRMEQYVPFGEVVGGAQLRKILKLPWHELYIWGFGRNSMMLLDGPCGRRGCVDREPTLPLIWSEQWSPMKVKQSENTDIDTNTPEY